MRELLAELYGLVEDLQLADVRVVLVELGKLNAMLWTKLVSESSGSPLPEHRLLKISEAAERLAVTEDWLYRHADQLPFTVRLTEQQLRFSSRGLDEFIETNMAKNLDIPP